MPNLDVAKVALTVLLVGVLVGLTGWFVMSIAPDIISSGTAATTALSRVAGPWSDITSLFGNAWSKAWDIGLAIVLLSTTAFFMFKLIRWVQ